MTDKQLSEIVKFVKPIYKKTGKYHGWDHILAVKRNALRLARKYPQADKKILEAASYIHDIGRSIKDEGHNETSAKLITPFLKKIKVDPVEIEKVCHAVISHEKGKVNSSKTIEAKILFDADKLEIMTVYGFIRVMYWLSDERKMIFSESLNFLWKWIVDVRKNYLQTSEAKKIVDKEMPVLKSMVEKFNKWEFNSKSSSK